MTRLTTASSLKYIKAVGILSFMAEHKVLLEHSHKNKETLQRYYKNDKNDKIYKLEDWWILMALEIPPRMKFQKRYHEGWFAVTINKR